MLRGKDECDAKEASVYVVVISRSTKGIMIAAMVLVGVVLILLAALFYNTCWKKCKNLNDYSKLHMPPQSPVVSLKPQILVSPNIFVLICLISRCASSLWGRIILPETPTLPLWYR